VTYFFAEILKNSLTIHSRFIAACSHGAAVRRDKGGRIAIKFEDEMPDSDIYDEINRTNMLGTNNPNCGAARFLRGE
jgi:hypothetical protein